MILLQCVNISKSFGADVVLANIKMDIPSRSRIALVGRNGAGKSTLLKIIAKQLSYDSGELIFAKGVNIGYLAQDTGLESNLSIWEEMLTAFSTLHEMEEKLRELEKEMSRLHGTPSNEDEKLLREYDQLQLRFKEEGGYRYEADIRSVLAGLRFSAADYDTSIHSLSGGQKTRLALGKLLLTKPDLLILDEPTNHLDIETLTWLEQYLTNYEGAVLVVSHDRYFLDKIVTDVYELSRTKITKYKGNYSDYVIEKGKRYEQERKQFERQQEEIARLKDFVSRNIARASTTKRAQSRKKQLEKIERLERPSYDEKSATFSFEIEKQTGNEVLKVQQLSLGFDGTPLFLPIDFQINKGERLALIGPNGIGKTTILKAIINDIQPLSGTIKHGSNVAIGYYDQEQAKLHSTKQVLHELWDDYPQADEKKIRTVLGNFLFTGDDVLKNVAHLSGGEKARLALAKLMMKKANFLILDEPTNHLDLDSKEVLEAALIDFPGTILFVSHDRYFLNRIGTRVIELSAEGLKNYLGDYDYYLQKKEEEHQQMMLAKEKLPHTKESQHNVRIDKKAKRKERQRLRRIEEIEMSVEQLEQKIAALEDDLCKPEVYENHGKAHALQNEVDSHHETIERLMDEWAQLESE